MKLSWKNIGVVVAASALVLVVVVIGFAQQGRPDGHRRGGGFGGGHERRGGGIPFARDLDLTDEQKAQIQKINASFEESTRTLREQLRTLHENQSDPLAGGTFDEEAVRKAAQDRAGIEVELEVARARMFSQAYAVLTTEQKAKLAERRQQFEQRHRGRGEGRPDATPVQ